MIHHAIGRPQLLSNYARAWLGIILLGAMILAVALCGCRTAPRVVPMVVDGKPAMALEFGANPQGDIDWVRTGGLAGGITAAVIGSIEYYNRNKGGRTRGDAAPTAIVYTQSGHAIFVGRDFNGTMSIRRDEAGE